MSPLPARPGRDKPAPFVVTQTPTIAKLARLCTEDAGCYLGRAPYAQCFCLEVFHRAVVGREDAAWAAIYAQHGDLVRHWLALPGVDGDEGVAAVFERFWRAVDADKFARFPSLAAVLRYLKACAYTVRMDRARVRATDRAWSLDASGHDLPSRDDVEETVVGRLEAADLWSAVRGVLGDEREGVILYLSFTLGLSPRTIQERHAGRFPDVAEVYRLKRNVLDRLRRAPEIRALARAV